MQQGDVLFGQNQPATGIFQVISGSATLRRLTAGGDLLTLHRAVSGGYFAEASIFSDAYHCEAICTKPGIVLKIEKVDIVKAIRSDPEFSEGVTRLLAVQVQHYRALIEILAIRSAKDRVIAAVQAGYLQSTVPEFASRINLTPEACYRALRALCDEGRLQQLGRGLYRLPS